MGNKNKLPNAFNVKQIQKVFNAMDRPKLAIAAFVSFFCGLRINEVCCLKVEDIDLVSKRLKVTDSKNPNRSVTGYGKDRYVPIPSKCISPIEKWLDIIGSDSKWFLPSMTSTEVHIRPKSLYEQFREALVRSDLLIPEFSYAERSGPRKGLAKTKHRFYFHSLRHSYATYLLGKGVDIYTISNLLGHNQVSTTQIYARISTTQQKEAVEDAFSGPLMEFKPNFRQHVQQSQPEPQMNEGLERLRLEVQRNQIELEKMKLFREHILVQKTI